MQPAVEASIDASSIIYLLKIGALGTASAAIRFYASPQIIAETGWPSLPVISFMPSKKFSTNDESVIYVASEKKIPVISEDKKILMTAEKMGLKYYNTGIVLNYLLKINRITLEEYGSFLTELKKISRYSSSVMDYILKDRDKILAYKGGIC